MRVGSKPELQAIVRSTVQVAVPLSLWMYRVLSTITLRLPGDSSTDALVCRLPYLVSTS